MSINEMDKPRIRVDFNELVQEDVVLLSKADEALDSDGSLINLVEGLAVSLYEFNHYADGTIEYLLAEGVAVLNDTNINGKWSEAAKWCCQINDEGIVVKIS
ncbi:hypothetical protein OAS86_04490 [Gammaproteobacteria bacterium]|nr:hypothetical protein [Gammaproteobacteria bacterium]